MTEPNYGEPWRVQKREGRAGSDVFDVVGNPVHTEGHDRSVACVNALAGRDPETVKRRLDERDELLAAAKALLDDYGLYGVENVAGERFVALATASEKAEGGGDRRFGEWCAKVVKDSALSPPVGFPIGNIQCPKCSACDIELRPHLDLARCFGCKHTWTLHVVSVQEAEGGGLVSHIKSEHNDMVETLGDDIAEQAFKAEGG